MTLPTSIVLDHGVHLPAFSTELVRLGTEQMSPSVHSEAPGWTLLVAHGPTARAVSLCEAAASRTGRHSSASEIQLQRVARAVSSGQSRKRAKESGSGQEFKM